MPIEDLELLRASLLRGNVEWAIGFIEMYLDWLQQDAAMRDKLWVEIEHGAHSVCQ